MFRSRNDASDSYYNLNIEEITDIVDVSDHILNVLGDKDLINKLEITANVHGTLLNR